MSADRGGVCRQESMSRERLIGGEVLIYDVQTPGLGVVRTLTILC